MNHITEQLLNIVSDWKGAFSGAFNIREDGGCAGRQSSEFVKIEPRDDGKGLSIYVMPSGKQETVYIPACITHGDVDDLVYNDFYISSGSDVVIVAGCGVNTDDEEGSRHNGIHRFFIDKNAKVLYREKHIGIGKGRGLKIIDPVTDITIGSDSVMEMDTVQLGGVDKTVRTTTAKLADRAKLVIRERLMTDGKDFARTDFAVSLDGYDSGADIVSRSVARGSSRQEYRSRISGNNKCSGHTECDAILAGNGTVDATPELFAGHVDASLIHEAAIGKIAGEQIVKLRTLGLTEQQAEERIIKGFLNA